MVIPINSLKFGLDCALVIIVSTTTLRYMLTPQSHSESHLLGYSVTGHIGPFGNFQVMFTLIRIIDITTHVENLPLITTSLLL